MSAIQNQILILFTLVCSSCSSIDQIRDLHNQTIKPSNIVVTNQSEKIKILKKVSNKNIDFVPDKHEFQVYKNEHVNKWITYFTRKDEKRFLEYLKRGTYYKELIQTVLEEEELPSILYYLPLIESGFKINAYSRASAVGPWQFIKGTAKRYGLTVNSFVDERRDPIHSTEAAVKYLNDLYNVFNSWELALAAYNCGEIRVLRAIMKGKTRDFWQLIKKKLLPRETRNYVPKFLAAAYLGENISAYNFSEDNNKSYPDVEVFEISGGVSLKTIAKFSKIPYIELIKINPALKKKRIPGWLKKYDLWVYPRYKKELQKSYSKIARSSQREKQFSSPNLYKIRNGDSLIKIAKKFKISLGRLKRYNNITSSRIFIGQKLIVRKSRYRKISGNKFYFVKRNEYLGRIARKFRLSVSYLKKLNGLLFNKLYVGQKLNVSKGVISFKYKVKRGDNLIRIAKLYNKSISHLRNKNSLRNNEIYIGQVLII